MEERIGEEGRERGEDNTVEYSQLMMTVCGCFVQTLQSLQSHSSFSFSSAFCIPPSAQRYTLVLPASYPPAAHGVDGHAGRGPVDGDWPVACGSEWPQ